MLLSTNEAITNRHRGPLSAAFAVLHIISLSPRSSLTFTHRYEPSLLMNDDCVTVDELLLEIADYKNNGQEVAVEQLQRLCSHSYEAYAYLQGRVHDTWLPERTRQHVRHVLLSIRMRLHAFEEYGRAYPEE